MVFQGVVDEVQVWGWGVGLEQGAGDVVQVDVGVGGWGWLQHYQVVVAVPDVLPGTREQQKSNNHYQQLHISGKQQIARNFRNSAQEPGSSLQTSNRQENQF